VIVSEESRIEAAQAYIDALVSRDGNAVRVNETFLIPAESPSGKAAIHHIKVRFQPFIRRSLGSPSCRNHRHAF
jgi:hypothetical protein